MSFPTNKELEDWPVTETPTEPEIGRTRSRAVELGGRVFGVPHSARATEFYLHRETAEGRLYVPGPATPVRIELASCGEYALFTLPLDYQKGWQGTAPSDSQLDANNTKLCVVDDAAHLWPRFR